MATTARVSVWAERGNGTVDLGRLAGPLCGEFVPPPHLAPYTSRSVFLLDEPDDRMSVYELVLCHGTADDVMRWVNLDELCRCLDDLNLPPHVVGPWRGALRDAGLLASDPADVADVADAVDAVDAVDLTDAVDAVDPNEPTQATSARPVGAAAA